MNMIPGYKDIIELVKKGATLEAQERIMELRDHALQLQEENQLLKQRLKEMEEALAIREQLRFDRRVYWLHKKGGQEDGPFCQHCYDVDQKLVRLQSTRGHFGRSGVEDGWECLACKNKVTRNP